MRRLLTNGLVALLFSTIGCAGTTTYYRGSPKRIDSQVRTGATAITAEVERTTGGDLYVVVFERTGVEVEKVLVYSTVEAVGEYRWWGELIEVPIGPVWLVGIGIIVLWDVTVVGGSFTQPETDSEKPRNPWNSLVLVFGPINPAQSAFFAEFHRYFDSEEELFRTAPVVVSFQQGRPLEAAPVSYEWKDGAGNVVGAGQGATDPFGRVAVSAAPVEDAKLEFRVGDGPVVRYDPALFVAAEPTGGAPPPAPPPSPATGEAPRTEFE